MQLEVIKNYHADAAKTCRNYKKLAERAIEQVGDEEFFTAIDEEGIRFELDADPSAPSAKPRTRRLTLKAKGE